MIDKFSVNSGPFSISEGSSTRACQKLAKELVSWQTMERGNLAPAKHQGDFISIEFLAIYWETGEQHLIEKCKIAWLLKV